MADQVQSKVGDKAPDFTLLSHLGDSVSLNEYRDQKNVVLAFHPLAWTSV